MSLRLEELGARHLAQLEAFRAAFIEEGIRISGAAGLELAPSAAAWLRGDRRAHYGNVEEKIYGAFDEAGAMVGISDIRLGENDFIRKWAGRIGYSVVRGERRKGYAAEILRLTLKEAFALGFDEVMVTCNENNAASAGTIEKAGGRLTDTVDHPGFPRVRQYLFTKEDI